MPETRRKAEVPVGSVTFSGWSALDAEGIVWVPPIDGQVLSLRKRMHPAGLVAPLVMLGVFCVSARLSAPLKRVSTSRPSPDPGM